MKEDQDLRSEPSLRPTKMSKRLYGLVALTSTFVTIVIMGYGSRPFSRGKIQSVFYRFALTQNIQ